MCLAQGHNPVMPVRLEPLRFESSPLPMSHCAASLVNSIKHEHECLILLIIRQKSTFKSCFWQLSFSLDICNLKIHVQ